MIKNTIKIPFLIVTLLLMGFYTNFAKQSPTALIQKTIDPLMQRAMEEFKVAGAAIAVVKDGKVIHKRGYGIRSLESKLPVDEFTNFQIASNTKAFTTAALAIMVDRGQLRWKDRVKRIIPEFTMYDGYVEENFTIEDLLCHRSGLGLGVGDLMAFPDGADFTIQDVLSSFQHFRQVSDFRTEYAYDNMLYWVAGEVIARVSGMSWEAFIQKEILDPLEMKRSYPSTSTMGTENLALPHSTETPDGTLKQIDLYREIISGALGGIVSNVDDMAKWMLMQLNEGKYGAAQENQLFSPARQKEMWQIHTVTNSLADPKYQQHFSGYGLGWNLSDLRGNLRASHTGALAGMLSQVYLIPDLDLGVVILTNTENGGASLFRTVNQTLVDHFLGLEEQDWIAHYSAQAERQKSVGDSVTTSVWEKVNQAKDKPVHTDDYVGVYEDKWFGQVEIFERANGQLWFRSLRSPKLNGPLMHYQANTFAIPWTDRDLNADAFALFSLDQNGRAIRFQMQGISPNIDFSYDFHDLDFVRVEDREWIQLFNGTDLDQWQVKIAKHELGINYGETFRVEDGLLKVRYDQYGDFDQQYGHLTYMNPYSTYVLRVEYRFTGEQAPGGEAWAWRNSGVMLHGQDPLTLLKDQDFPISIEAQLLGGDGISPRSTGNLCTPGTQVYMDGSLVTAHCIHSSSPTFHGDQWVKAEFVVLGDSVIHHFINGEQVLSYSKPEIGGEQVIHFDPNQKQDGKVLRTGFISLQSESHPVDFRKVELLDLRPYTHDPDLLEQKWKEGLENK